MKKSAGIILGIAAVIFVRSNCARFVYRAILGIGGAGLSPESQMLVAMACDGVVMVALAWLATGLLNLDRRRVFTLSWPLKTTIAGAALGILALLINRWIVSRYFPLAEASSQPVAVYLHGGGGAAMRFALGFGLIVFSPLVEELYFRGLIQNGLDAAVPIVGAAAATYLFVSEHSGSLTSPAMWMLGGTLALIYRYTKSIHAVVVCHGVNNCLAVYLAAAK